ANVGVAGGRVFQGLAQVGDGAQDALLLRRRIQGDFYRLPTGRHAIELDHHATENQLVRRIPISVDRPRGEHQVGIDGWVGEIRGGRQVIDDVLALRSEVHTHPCRRKRRVSRDSHLVLYQRRGNAQGRARCRTRTVDFAPVAPRVGDVLEYRLAAVADGDAQRTGDLQFALALVTLVAVAAVG